MILLILDSREENIAIGLIDGKTMKKEATMWFAPGRRRRPYHAFLLVLVLVCGIAVPGASDRSEVTAASEPDESGFQMDGVVTLTKDVIPSSPVRRPAAFAMNIERELGG